MDETTEKNILSTAHSQEMLINNVFITKSNFMNIEFHFEKDFSTTLKMDDENYESDKERANVLKEILFEINKENNVRNKNYQYKYIY